jgi:hypothetical protein
MRKGGRKVGRREGKTQMLVRVIHDYNPSYSGGLWFETSPAQVSVKPYLKNKLKA